MCVTALSCGEKDTTAGYRTSRIYNKILCETSRRNCTFPKVRRPKRRVRRRIQKHICSTYKPVITWKNKQPTMSAPALACFIRRFPEIQILLELMQDWLMRTSV